MFKIASSWIKKKCQNAICNAVDDFVVETVAKLDKFMLKRDEDVRAARADLDSFDYMCENIEMFLAGMGIVDDPDQEDQDWNAKHQSVGWMDSVESPKNGRSETFEETGASHMPWASQVFGTTKAIINQEVALLPK